MGVARGGLPLGTSYVEMGKLSKDEQEEIISEQAKKAGRLLAAALPPPPLPLLSLRWLTAAACTRCLACCLPDL
jgi:hypothetical protein